MNKEAQKLKELLIRILGSKEKTNLLILIDSSGSVSLDNFENTKAFVKQVIQKSDIENVSLSFGQFSSKCELYTEFSSNRDELLNSLERMKKTGGDTDLFQAIEFVKSTFSPIKTTGNKVLIMVTDDVPDNDHLMMGEIVGLTNMGITPIGIGIGVKGKNRFQDIFNSGFPFLLDEYQDILQVFPQSQNPAIRLTCKQMKVPISIKEPCFLEIEIENTSLNEVPIHSRLEIDGGMLYGKILFVVPRVVKEILKIGHELEPKIETLAESVLQLPEYINITLYPPNNNLEPISSVRFKIQISNYTKEFQHWKPPKNYYKKANILFCGPTGVGKSTLINSLFSLCSQNFESPANSLTSQARVTQKLTYYQAQGKYSFFDSAGWSPNTMFSDHEISCLMRGTLPLGYTFFRDPLSPDDQNLQEINEDVRPHCCVLVVDQAISSEVVDTRSKKVETLKKFIEEAVKFDLHVMIVVTKMDLNQMSSKEQLDNVHSVTGIPKNNIFLVDNSSPEKKDLNNQKVLYLLLDSILRSASHFMENDFLLNQKFPEKRSPTTTSSNSNSSTSTFSVILPYFAIKEVNENNENKILGIVSGQLDIDETTLQSLRPVIEQNIQRSDTSMERFDFFNIETNQTIPHHEEDTLPARSCIQIVQATPYVYIKMQPPAYS